MQQLLRRKPIKVKIATRHHELAETSALHMKYIRQSVFHHFKNKNVPIKTWFYSVRVVKWRRSAEDSRLCASHLFSPIHIFQQPQLPLSQNSAPLPLKLEYINKSCLHINSCWCSHSNLLKYALIYKDTQCLVFLKIYVWIEAHCFSSGHRPFL